MAINKLLGLISFFNTKFFWLYLMIILCVFYLIISLLTWSIKKPLMFLGIPSVVVGIILMIIRFFVRLLPLSEKILAIINSAIKPLFVNGVICIVLGVIMIGVYGLLNVIHKKKKMIQEIEV